MTDTLSPLVEAATALAALNPARSWSGVSSPPAPNKIHHMVSDEASPSKNKRDTFPQRLMDTLNDPSLSDVITWLPHGRSFVVLRPDVFTADVLGKYFPSADARSTKYASFTRKLNRWGFRQATRGPDTGAFHHPLFLKDEPESCLGMVCQRTKSQAPKHKKNERKRVVESPKMKKNSSTKKIVDLVETRAVDTIPQPQPPVATVSDDNQSKSSDESSFGHNERRLCTDFICTDEGLVREALRKRDELERMNAIKAMLYASYLEALKGKN